MNNKVISLLFLILASLYVNAQDVDETMLVGRWVKTSSEGEFRPLNLYGSKKDYSLQNPDVLTFYNEPSGLYSDDSLGMVYISAPVEHHYTRATEEYEIKMFGIQDYFITKGNILHICINGDRIILRMKIIDFDENMMVLSTFNGKGTVTFSRDITSSVRSTTRSASEDDSYYTLKGTRLKTKPNKETYIRRGKVYAPAHKGSNTL